MDKLIEALSNFGFELKGDFEPIEVDADDFTYTCEIGSWIIAIQPEYIALLNYTEMVYWDIENGSIKIALDAIAAIAAYEIKRNVERSHAED